MIAVHECDAVASVAVAVIRDRNHDVEGDRNTYGGWWSCLMVSLRRYWRLDVDGVHSLDE